MRIDARQVAANRGGSLRTTKSGLRKLTAALVITAAITIVPAAPANAGAAHARGRITPEWIDPSSTTFCLPDGQCQKVSGLVAHALDIAFNGGNASTAYAGTGVRFPWIDPSNLMTGDVAFWQYNNAVLIVENSGLFAIINGQMTPFNANGYGYGNFQGFSHPSG
ncbi:hypothetical protein HUT16_30210 [Kitasatospora sp. NA04385]|uniref:hypothetical protein n=1 Tax=Kitasatospora sp. NA04385 TaxID=2742135 RepID=UPI00159239C8|nr:hypothetical protein [Kitasatospora sp. NA04385]QKW22796.1 hypothetical protein HUT16_30210 [Kitasatospora sp. NA04385]